MMARSAARKQRRRLEMEQRWKQQKEHKLLHRLLDGGKTGRTDANRQGSSLNKIKDATADANIADVGGNASPSVQPKAPKKPRPAPTARVREILTSPIYHSKEAKHKLRDLTDSMAQRLDQQIDEAYSAKLDAYELRRENAALLQILRTPDMVEQIKQQDEVNEDVPATKSAPAVSAKQADICNNIAAAIKRLIEEKNHLTTYKVQADRAIQTSNAALADRARVIEAGSVRVRTLAAENAALKSNAVDLRKEVEWLQRTQNVLNAQLEESEHSGNEKASLVQAHGQERDREMRLISNKLGECLSAMGVRLPTPKAPAAMCGYGDVEAQVSAILDLVKELQAGVTEKGKTQEATSAETTEGKPKKQHCSVDLKELIEIQRKKIVHANSRLARSQKSITQQEQNLAARLALGDITPEEKDDASSKIAGGKRRSARLQRKLPESQGKLVEFQQQLIDVDDSTVETPIQTEGKRPAPTLRHAVALIKQEGEEEYDGNYIYDQLQQQKGASAG